MVVKKYIEASLKRLDRQYNRALTAEDRELAVYASKLAVIEYCGWLEESMDSIAFAYARGRLRSKAFQKDLAKRINGIHGFTYSRHFRPMLIHVLGLVRCEVIQRRLEKSGELEALISELEAYVSYRNDAAHSYVNRILPRYPSPSATMGSFGRVLPILKRIYNMRRDGSCI